MKHQLLVVALLASASLQANTVIDTWNDLHGATNGMTLTTLNTVGVGGVGFLSKYEQTGSGVPVLRTNDLTVPLTHYVTGQTSYTQHWSVAAVTTSSGAARRTQTRTTPAFNLPIWFSFIAGMMTTNADVALTFNGVFNGSGVANNGTVGMRVGLGNYATARCRGALGVGPLAISSGPADLTTINNGVNGMVTTNNFVPPPPAAGTAGLVLGLIDYDPATGYPRVQIWWNPDVRDAASLPAPTLSFVDPTYQVVPTSVTCIGEQVNRSAAPATQNEVIDNVKVSDEANGFDIVYLNAPLPVPIITIATTTPGSDVGPTNVVFTVTANRPPLTAVTIPYTYSGVATNGYVPYSSPASYYYADYSDPNFNADTLTSSITLAAGQTNTAITLYVTDNGVPKAVESVGVNLTPAADNSYLLGVGSASTVIVPANTANVSVQYMFVNNFTPQIWDTNITATPVNAAGVGSGWSSAYNNTGYGAYDYPAPNSCLAAPSSSTATNTESAALAAGSFISCDLGPIAGRTLTLTNLEFMSLYGNYLNQNPLATGAVVFVRSSLDNFATDLGSFPMVPAETLFPNGGWYTNVIPLGSQFASVPSVVEFRLYVYDDTVSTGQVGVRLGNLFFSGGTAPLPAGIDQVTVAATANSAALGGASGQFTISRVGDASNPLTVSYTMAGTASNGVDYVLLPGSATIPAGQSNVVVTLTPLPPAAGEPPPVPSQTATLNLVAGSTYGVLSPAADTVTIGPRGGLATWYFNEANNGAVALNAAAVPLLTSADVQALNATAGWGLGPFGANNGGGVGNGYATTQWRSAPSTVFMNGNYWSTNEPQTVAQGAYFSFSVGAVSGYAITLTNFTGWAEMAPTVGQTNWAVLRSSLDNFTSDLGTITIPANSVANSFAQWSVPLNVANWPAAVEFRVYVWGTRVNGGDIFRLDDVTLLGSATTASSVTTVSVTGTANATEPATPGGFTLTRTGDPSSPLTVNYSLGGSARDGLDYAYLSGLATFPAGITNLSIPVVGIPNTNPPTTDYVTLTILTNATCFPGLPVSGVVSIATVTAPFITSYLFDFGLSTVTINFSAAATDTTTTVHLQSSATVTGPYADDNSAVITGASGVFQATTALAGSSRFYRIRR